MDQLANELMKMGLLGAKGQSDEMGQFLAMIQRFAEAVSQDQETATACQHFVRIIIEETGFENCSILFWNQLTSRLSLVAAYGLDDQLEVASRRYRQNLRFGSGQSISGQVFSSGKSVFIENTAEHPIPEIQDAVVTPVSLACVPILHLGVLNLSAYHPQEFTHQIRRNWEMIGNIIGHLIVGLQCAREAGAGMTAESGRPETAASVNPEFPGQSHLRPDPRFHAPGDLHPGYGRQDSPNQPEHRENTGRKAFGHYGPLAGCPFPGPGQFRKAPCQGIGIRCRAGGKNRCESDELIR